MRRYYVRTEEEGDIQRTVKRRKADCIAHIWRRNAL
jgi:hypothetical protein